MLRLFLLLSICHSDMFVLCLCVRLMIWSDVRISVMAECPVASILGQAKEEASPRATMAQLGDITAGGGERVRVH